MIAITQTAAVNRFIHLHTLLVAFQRVQPLSAEMELTVLVSIEAELAPIMGVLLNGSNPVVFGRSLCTIDIFKKCSRKLRIQRLLRGNR
jgi:hypothetical protein